MDKGKRTESTSLLSRNVTIEGEIIGEENLHVDGCIKGSITLTGNLFVGNAGVVEADVEATNIVIQGKIVGNVVAKRQLEIQPSGKLIGDCTAASIDIREGAVFEGRSNMIRLQPTASQPAAPAATVDKVAAEGKKG